MGKIRRVALPSREYLQSLFVYDPAIRGLRWKVGRGGVRAGDIAGQRGSGRWPYVRVEIDGQRFAMHRIVVRLLIGCEPEYLDHVNFDVTDNRIENLRPVSATKNIFHQRRPNRCGTPGVQWEFRRHWRTPKYRAYINVAGRQIRLGHFQTLEAAVAARKAAELQYYGRDPRSVVRIGEQVVRMDKAG